MSHNTIYQVLSLFSESPHKVFQHLYLWNLVTDYRLPTTGY